MTKKTALLLFYQDSKNESKAGINQKSTIFNSLNDHLIKKLRYQPYDLILYSEDQQNGDDFGTKYYNALKDTFALGYDKIISIGNDTPQLSAHHIQQADRSAGQQKICIGPSNDGGFYLLALQKSDFEKIDFNKIDWQTSRVFRQLTDQLDEKYITFDKLQSLTDIDDASSLQKVLQELPLCHRLKQLLSAGLTKQIIKVLSSTNFQEHQYIAHFFNKGSPGSITTSG
jgi:hypothetical protein